MRPAWPRSWTTPSCNPPEPGPRRSRRPPKRRGWGPIRSASRRRCCRWPALAREIRITAVCGFPSGKHHSSVKAAEAREAVRNGADEIDMVLDVGAVRAGDYDAVERDISAVREAVPAPTVLKVILESAALTDEQIVRCCAAAESSGADFVKTSTGFHPGGGATVHAVELMARTVAPAPRGQGVRRHPGLGCSAGDDRGRRYPAGTVGYGRRPQRRAQHRILNQTPCAAGPQGSRGPSRPAADAAPARPRRLRRRCCARARTRPRAARSAG